MEANAFSFPASILKSLFENDRLPVAAAANFRALVEHALVGIYVIQDGKIVYGNPRIMEVSGYNAEELASVPVLDFIVPSDRELVAENIRQRLAETLPSVRYQAQIVRKDGTLIAVETHGAAVQYQGHPAILGTLLDVTERKKAEENIQLLNQQLEDRVLERTAQLETILLRRVMKL